MAYEGGLADVSVRPDGTRATADLFTPERVDAQAKPRLTAVAGAGGHRERLRERARAAGLEHLPDYELLELFLFRSIPQRDVKPLAKALLARFGSLSAALAASEAELTQVSAVDLRGRALKVGPETALDLRLLHEATKRVALAPVKKRTVITSWSQLLAYVRVALADEPREQFRVLYPHVLRA